MVTTLVRLTLMNGKYIKFILDKGYRKLTNRFVRILYQDNIRKTNKCILVVGSARSGTTWLSDIIASQLPSRIMFEPFNPDLVPEYSGFNYFQYMRPEEENEALSTFCQKVFSGDIRNSWIDREVKHFFPQQRVIKCIRSSLMLKWIDTHFPEVRKIFIIRHPCAVVQSRLRLNWATDGDIRYFFTQPKLIEDFLKDKLKIFSEAKTDVEKHALIWSVTNLVPITQFSDDRLNLFWYEDLVNNAEEEFPRLLSLLNLPDKDFTRNTFSKPSITSTRNSAIMSSGKFTDQWKKDMSSTEIDSVMDIVDGMGLGYLF